MREEPLRSVDLRVPVTALASCPCDGRPVMLVGQGRFLTAYLAGTSPSGHRLQVFQAANVHAIRSLADSGLLVTGGKSVTRLNLVPATGQLVVVVEETVLSDWIWDSAESGDSLLFLTGHNRVITTGPDLAVRRSFGADEKCILYSGLLRNLHRN